MVAIVAADRRPRSSLSILLAVAETALTRVSKAKAQALAETDGKRGEVLLVAGRGPGVAEPARCSSCSSTQLVQSTLLGVLAARLFGGWGVVVATLINVTLVLRGGRGGAEDLGDPAHRPGGAGRRPAGQGAGGLGAAAAAVRGA